MIAVRTFICIELSGDVRKKLAELQSTLRQTRANIAWVKPENMHLTLKFLGNVEQSKLGAVSAAVERALKDQARFSLKVSGMGSFPNNKRPRVLWVGIEGDKQMLSTIQRRIEDELVSEGFPKEDRPFSPHLTLGRVKSNENIKACIDKMNELSIDSEPFEIAEVIVMRSDLNPGGAVYSRLNTISLNVMRNA